MLADKSGAGAFPRDKVDARIVKEVKSGLCTYTGAGDANSGAIPGIINSPDEAEGLDGLTYKTSGTITDADQDGMDDAWEKKVGLDPALKRPVGKYSLGMRQRLALAQAIMEDPGILILDEPMNGLDKNGVREIRELLLKMKEENKLIILASHNREDIEVLCDEVYEMEGGVISKVKDETN